MGRKGNAMELVRKSTGRINDRYDMTITDMNSIMGASRDAWDLICNGFRFGYLQGMEAARAEMRKQSA